MGGKRPCLRPGCPTLVDRGRPYCTPHTREADAAKPERLRGRAAQRRRTRFLSQSPLCAECVPLGITRAATEVDHKLPLEQGGADEWDNLQGLCHEHHVAKTSAERRARLAVAGVG